MNNLDFPSKEEAEELTLNELMQAIAMAGLWVEIAGKHRRWQARVLGGGLIYFNSWSDKKDSPRAALDDACDAWRKEASDG